MTDTVKSIADLIRSDDARNHAVAAAIASDEDFVAAVELIYEDKFTQSDHYVRLSVVRSEKIELYVHLYGAEAWRIVVRTTANDGYIVKPQSISEAALHLKKLLLCETS